MIEFAEL